MNLKDYDYENAAASVVFEQLNRDPLGPGVLLDPDVADVLGAAVQDDFPLDACDDDGLLTVNDKGEVVYGHE